MEQPLPKFTDWRAGRGQSAAGRWKPHPEKGKQTLEAQFATWVWPSQRQALHGQASDDGVACGSVLCLSTYSDPDRTSVLRNVCVGAGRGAEEGEVGLDQLMTKQAVKTVARRSPWSFAGIFSRSVACLLLLFIVSFADRNFNFNEVQLPNCFFHESCLSCCS